MDKVEIYKASNEEVKLCLAEDIKAGFPSPANDFTFESLNITDKIVKNPASTFYARVNGQSMVGDGISDGDIIVVDKSIEPHDGCIAICYIDGEFTLKRVKIHKDSILLVPANNKFKPIKVTSENDFIIWGIAKYVIKKLD
ncbi:MAG: translesion error-prone DNA polymerase V autoproteolytic subunit [Bacteroidales bacterium]